MKHTICFSLLLAGLLISTAQAEIVLKFGVYTSDKPTTMVRMFRPILDVLEQRLTEKLGEAVGIKLHVANNYDQGIDNLVSGLVDFGRMGPASYVLSKDRNPDLKIIAMESKKGKKIFYGIICVQDDSDIESLEQLKGKSFAFGNERSTIGRYLSQYMLSESGVYADDLVDYKYLGRHDRVGSAVGARQFDAGALKESTFKKLREQGVKIRELARFPNVTKPWIASSKLNSEIFTALREVLLSIEDPAVLKALKKQGFLPAQDSDYASIRDSMLSNSEFFQ